MSHCSICLFRFSEFRNTQYATALTTVNTKMTLGHFICTVGITRPPSVFNCKLYEKALLMILHVADLDGGLRDGKMNLRF